MKLNGKTMAMVVAMSIGVLGATGCSNPMSGGGNEVAPEENVAAAPVEDSTTPGAENWRHVYGNRRYYAPYGPPASRREVYGRAPSSNHFWSNGYYRWNGRQHVWYGGSWQNRRTGYEYASPRWEHRWGRWEYVPGHWVRRY